MQNKSTERLGKALYVVEHVTAFAVVALLLIVTIAGFEKILAVI